MARAYKCDSCGKFYTENKLVIPSFNENVVINYIKIGSISHSKSIDYDLCDECLEKILNILHVKAVDLGKIGGRDD